MNDTLQAPNDRIVTYNHSRVRRALGVTLAALSLLVGLSCQVTAFVLVLLVPHGADSSPAELTVGAVLVGELIILIGFGALVWGVPAGLGLFRWRLTVSDDGIGFRGPFGARSLSRPEFIAAWVRRWRVGPRVLRIEGADRGRAVIFVPRSLVDPRLSRWADGTSAVSGVAAGPPSLNQLEPCSVARRDGSTPETAPSPNLPAANLDSIERESIAELARRVKDSWVTWIIIGINVLMFLVTIAVADGGKITPAIAIRLGANAGVYSLRGDWWRLWTSTFIHFGFIHVAVNMVALWQCGRMVEALYGRVRFVIIYLAAGGFGSLLSALVHIQTASAGASGAIFGLYGALLSFSMHRGALVYGDVFKRIRASAIVFCLFNLVNGFAHTGIDNAAHLGGLAGGLIAGALLRRPIIRGCPVKEHWARPAVITTAALYLTLSLPVLCALAFPHHPATAAGSIIPQSAGREITSQRGRVNLENPGSANERDGSLRANAIAAANRLALKYRKGLDVPVNAAEATKWYRTAADLGDAEAQYNLGDMYENGEGVPKNMPAAVEWYTKAADQGAGLAQDRLGHIYDSGIGVPQDSTKAIMWYTKAAEQGEVLDQYKLGEIYYQGTGTRKNVAEAIRWYQKAAEQGFDAASYRLNAINANGQGVSK
jgi:membrane associated rhomboid family serine protease